MTSFSTKLKKMGITLLIFQSFWFNSITLLGGATFFILLKVWFTIIQFGLEYNFEPIIFLLLPKNNETFLY